MFKKSNDIKDKDDKGDVEKEDKPHTEGSPPAEATPSGDGSVEPGNVESGNVESGNVESGDRGDDVPLLAGSSAPPLKPFSKKGSHLAPPASPARPNYRPEAPKRFMGIPAPGGFGSGNRGTSGSSGNQTARRTDLADSDHVLTVGRAIVLKGEIVACEHLVVQGEVEADLTDGRLIEVSETGTYRGSAVVEEAVISGHFDGNLTAKEKLTIKESGRVSGSIQYGRIVIESGGEISGDMQSIPPGRST